MSPIHMIPFAKVPICGNEFKYLKEVLDSGWLTTASKASLFEQKFGEYVGAKYICAVNSCTAALHLGIDSLGVKMGEKVFVQSMTFTASAEVIRYLGAHPVFLDIEYGSNLITPEILKEAIKNNPDVKYIVIVHYGGQAAQMTSESGENILDICKSHGIRILEDAAHAFPSKLNGRMIGSFGDITCFSFYANKTITTGEGGMLVTDDEEIFQRVKIMRLHGMNKDVWDRYTSDKPSWEYDVVEAGFKYNMPDVNAAIGLAQLEQAELFRIQRQRVAEFYFEHLGKIDLIDLPVLHVPPEDHSWHLFPIVLNENVRISRNEFIDKMFEAGIGTSVHYKPLHHMTYFKNKYNLSPADFPNTERTWRGNVSLPIYPYMSDEDLLYICKTIEKLLEEGTTDDEQFTVGSSVDVEQSKSNLLIRPKIGLSIPHMGGTEQKYIQEAFSTNWIAPLGSNVDAFEESIVRYCGVNYAVVLSSGTAAIHIALIILGVEYGDEVITSSFTFSATVNPIVYVGATPILVDSEPKTWNMSPELLETAIKDRLSKGKKPKAIIPVHLYGMPANMEEIMKISNQYEIPVIEDAAEALGSRYKDNSVGSFGKMAVLSFNGNKIITTSGGGALISDNEELIAKARFLSTQARDKALHYQHSQIGYNYRMSNVLAGIGRGQMEVIEERLKRRRDNFFFYKKNLEKYEGISFLEEPDKSYFSNHWLTTILIDPLKTGTSWEVIQKELEKENIESRPLWKPMHLQPVFLSCPAYLNGTSEESFTKGLCLPSGSILSENDRQRVLNVLNICLTK